MAISAAAAIVLAALGPFGTWEAGLGRRMMTWVLFVLAGYICFRPVILAGDALAAQTSLPRWLAIAAACALAAMPTTIIVAGIASGFDLHTSTVADLAGFYLQILIVGGTITLIQLLIGGKSASGNAAPAVALLTSPEPATPPPPSNAAVAAASLIDLLPPHLGRDIHCIENEDHYIRVHTALGNTLLLMRLRDAVSQLRSIEGERVHRSWWVARAAVRDVVRTERRIALRLIDGREVPVSRASAAVLRERGWI